MSHQNYHQLKLKGQTYYVTRRVPKALQSCVCVGREGQISTPIALSAADMATPVDHLSERPVNRMYRKTVLEKAGWTHGKIQYTFLSMAPRKV